VEASDKALKAAGAIGLGLSVFFATGFVAGTSLAPGTASAEQPEEPETAQPEAGEEDEGTDVTQEEAIQKGVSALESGPLSYPFTYNLSTESVNRDELGGTYFYNWTVSYVVDANPFDGPIYSVPGNSTSTEKTLTLYVSRDGDHMFQSPPIETTARRPR
jgi:hypothetical protein